MEDFMDCQLPQLSIRWKHVFALAAISKIPVVIKGRALAHLSKMKKSKNPQNSSLFLRFFDSFIFKICTKFAALLTKGVIEMASRVSEREEMGF
jgi:hypothetical protein